MTESRRPLCSDVSRVHAEPLAATASRVDRWILVEYRGLWNRDAVAGSGLSDQAKNHLRAQADGPRTKLLFVRRPDRRGRSALAVFWGSCRPDAYALSTVEISSYDDLLELDFSRAGPPLRHPLFLVCTHGKHDRCCARYGRPVYSALAEQADPEWVWQSSHVGGDRFAGNVVVLPEGLYYGRVRAADALALVDEHLAGRVLMELFRGRSAYGFPVQAADIAVRRSRGLVRIDEPVVESVARDGSGWLVRLRSGGEAVAVAVAEEAGELTHLTCASAELRRPRRFVARILP